MGERGIYIPPEAVGKTIEQDQMERQVGKVLQTRSSWKHFTPQFVGTRSANVSVEALAGLINQRTQIYQEARVEQPLGKIKINSKYPIGIVHIGDIHLGSVYTNTDEVLRKFKMIKEYPNLYVVLMSNLIDNAIPSQFPDSMMANAINPNEQVMMMRAIVKDLNHAGKVLAAVTSPCHEGWTWKKAGQDINDLIFGFKERKFPVLENGGELLLRLGQETYRGALYHQVGPFESQFNETHALRQMNRLQKGMGMDWIAGAHRHFAAAQTVYEDSGDNRHVVGYLRTGTEKGTGDIHDAWAVGRYGNSAEPTGQTLHLWPNERRILATLDFNDGVMAHEAFFLHEMAKK